MKDKLAKQIEKLGEENKSLPSKRATVRGAVAAIPWIGGALDHLIFDRAEEIKIENIEKSVEELKKKLQDLDENSIDKKWFESVESLQMFKQLVEKIEFEPSDEKIKTLAHIYCISGTNEFKDDPNKFAILNKVAQMTDIQKKIIILFAQLKPENREFSGGGLSFSGTAVWLDQVGDKLKNDNPYGQFWKGKLIVDRELDILTSLNLLRRSEILFSNTSSYTMTNLGLKVVDYLSK